MNNSLHSGYNGSVLSIKYLFRITILLAATFVVVLLSSCQGERGPMEQLDQWAIKAMAMAILNSKQ